MCGSILVAALVAKRNFECLSLRKWFSIVGGYYNCKLYVIS